MVTSLIYLSLHINALYISCIDWIASSIAMKFLLHCWDVQVSCGDGFLT